MLKNKLFGIVSLGCDKNRVDTEKMMGLLRKYGCSITDDLASANVIIINTCAFLNSARKESIETIITCNEYRKEKLEKLVITGCLPQKYVSELEGKLTEADVFLGINDYDKIFEALDLSYKKEGQINMVGVGNGQYSEERILSTGEHFAYLKIADGCYNKCTYCLIPKIRGKYVSYPMEKLLSEVGSLGELSELIIVAQDVTRYGEDLYGENKLVDLLKNISKYDNIRHIRLLYCYPEAVSDELIAEIRDNPKILKYIDIPLQHSESNILKLMNRKGTREGYLSLFKKLRDEIPDICIRSTFIAGFPGETEEDHQNMIAFLKEAKLDNCGFFAYSKEPDTAAARMKGQLNQSIKNKRVKALYAAQKEVSAEKLSQMIGKELTVVCDGIDYDKDCFIGRSYKNAPDIDGVVYFNALEAIQGEEYTITVRKTDSYDLYGATKEYEYEKNEL